MLHGMRARVVSWSSCRFRSVSKLWTLASPAFLLQSSRPVSVGTRGSLRLNIGGAPFLVEVTSGASRPVPPGNDLTYRIGAQFVSISPEHRQVIDRFTNQ